MVTLTRVGRLIIDSSMYVMKLDGWHPRITQNALISPLHGRKVDVQGKLSVSSFMPALILNCCRKNNAACTKKAGVMVRFSKV